MIMVFLAVSTCHTDIAEARSALASLRSGCESEYASRATGFPFGDVKSRWGYLVARRIMVTQVRCGSFRHVAPDIRVRLALEMQIQRMANDQQCLVRDF